MLPMLPMRNEIIFDASFYACANAGGVPASQELDV